MSQNGFKMSDDLNPNVGKPYWEICEL